MNTKIKKKSNEPPAITQQKVNQHILTQTFSGPIPPPKLLEEYNMILPGSAERILSMAEAEANHRHEMERTVLFETASEVKRGQKYALFMGSFAITASVIAAFIGAEKTAMIIGGSTVVGLVTAFIIGRFKKTP